MCLVLEIILSLSPQPRHIGQRFLYPGACNDHGPHVDTMLNPYLLDALSIHEGLAVKLGSLDVMRRLTTCVDGQYGQVVAKFQPNKERRGAFANMHLAMEPTFHPTSGGTLWMKVAHTCLLLRLQQPYYCANNNHI